MLFCNPVVKINAGVRHRIEERCTSPATTSTARSGLEPTTFAMRNQLEADTLTVTSWELLCEPSEKHGFMSAG